MTPLFVLIALGTFLKKINIINTDFVATGNKLCFNVFLPVMLFSNLYNVEFKSAYNFKLIVFAICTIFILVVLGMLIVPLFVKSKGRTGAIIQTLFRGNYLFFGIPLSRILAGDEGVMLATSFMAFTIPTLNILAVFILTHYNDNRIKANVWGLTLNIIKNPLIIGVISGVLFSLSGLRLPTFLQTPVSDISKMANSFAFIILGAQFTFRNSFKNIKAITITLITRLVLIPSVVLTIAVVFFGFTHAPLVIIFILVTSPCAVSSYQMAYQFGADYELACDLVVYSMLFSSVTLFAFVFMLKALGLI